MAKFNGFPYPITKDPKGYYRVQSGTSQIKSDLLSLLLTNPGERCLTSDTKIPLANGSDVPIKELVGAEPFWVYSYDADSNSIVAGKATAHKTLENAELFEIILDNNERVRCTSNHLWLLRDGKTYRRTDELCIGDSLMPLYRNLNTSGYERVYQPCLGDYRETHLCFVFEKRLSGLREVVHHKDLDKRNNCPDNLQWMTCEAHRELHKQISNAFVQKMKNDPEFKAEFALKVKNGLKKYYETHGGNRKGVTLSEETKKKLSISKKKYYETEDGQKMKKHLSNLSLEQFENGHTMQGKKMSEEAKQKMRKPRPSMRGDNNPAKRPEVKEKIRLAKLQNKNHKVVCIQKLSYREDCYDLYVEKYHNFALAAGVFVHNCMLPSFGVDFRGLIFDPNDSFLIEEARNRIIDAINKWEPRVKIEQLEVFSNLSGDAANPLDDLSTQEHVLTISIIFRDPDDIQTIQELNLTVPLG